MIESIEMGLANLTSEAELVGTGGVGDDIVRVPSQVTAALRVRNARLLESLDAKVWSSDNGAAVVEGVRAKEQTYVCWNEAVVEVIEKLIEVVCAEQDLIGQARRESGIQYR